MSRPRYAIGIDLGTTNCVLAWVDLRAPGSASAVLALPQLHGFDTLIDSPLLPSFFYYCTEQEAAQAQLDPFGAQTVEEPSGYVVGTMARERMSTLPGRVIQSAKSWLAHAGVDRESRILPFGSEEIAAELRLSPVEASAAYLEYLKRAWDHAFAHEEDAAAFAHQHIVVTVPASFDEGAQALTRKAAELAGYPGSFRLLEEPQAAFYDWLGEAAGEVGQPPGARLLAALPALAHACQTVLVCDIGGGTSDFSLFRIAPPASADALPAIERIAASDHLLLGGDNIDLALAHLLEPAFLPQGEERLSRRQWMHLLPQARALKERVLDEDGAPDETFRVSIPGEGTALFSGAMSAAVSRQAVRRTVLDGFFPEVEADARPQVRRAGLREIGLPYAADGAISRHLAAFLDGRRVDALLCVGGTLRPRPLQERLLALVGRWQGQSPARLALQDMSLAVARGAARFASLAEGARERIGGGYPRSVYLELQADRDAMQAPLVCVLPQGFEEGGRLALETPAFELLVNRPVRFSACTSNRRPQDRAGDIVMLDRAAFHPLPPLYATIVVDADAFSARKAAEQRLGVRLEGELTELGVLRLALVGVRGEGRWDLEFNLRKPLAEPAQREGEGERARVEPPPVATGAIEAARSRITLFYGKKQAPGAAQTPKALVRDLEGILRREREGWSVPLLRALWPELHPGMTRRNRSLAHENAWLYLAGYLLRPGYGDELDAWRMTQLWECFDLGLAHRREKSAQSNWWMMWRRTAGGLQSEQQERVFEAAWPQIRRAEAEFVEGTRLLGSLERIATERKLELAARLFETVLGGRAAKQPHVFWALGRVLSRVPLYTAAETVIPPLAVEECFAQAQALDWKKLGLQPLNAVFSAACRLTGSRALDIDDRVRGRVVDKLRRSGAGAEQIRVVQEYCEISAADRNELFGEQLPAGLRLAG
jgi:molecular chaperone DnaK (HSP70)